MQRECARVSAKATGNKIDRMGLGWRRGTSTDWRTVFRISGSMQEKMGIPHLDVFPPHGRDSYLNRVLTQRRVLLLQ